MSIRSMTGFARSDGATGGLQWHWEVRTVNGRSLDVRLRLPPGLEVLEAPAREAIQRRLARGSCTATLSIERFAEATQIRINQSAVAQVLAAVEKVRATADLQPLSADGLLSVRGVLEVVEAADEPGAADTRNAALLKGLDEALTGVAAARAGEGKRLAVIIAEQIDRIETLVAEAERAPARRPELIAKRLREQVQRLIEAAPALDESRLYQEAVLLAAKADIEEEIKRLRAHVAQARELIAAVEPAGRRLDFLAQEFNREANTLCSKSGDTELTRTGLALKAVIDQLREQVQNIE